MGDCYAEAHHDEIAHGRDAATIAAGIAIFMTVAPQAKAPPQVTSAVAEHALAKGDRLRPLVKGAACSGQSWPNSIRPVSSTCANRPITSALSGCSIWRGRAPRST